MKTVPLHRATAALTEFVAKRDDQPLVLTQRGKPVAFVLPCADADAVEHFSWAMSPKLRQFIHQASEEIRQGKGIPHEEFWRQLDAEYATRDAQTVTKAATQKPAKLKTKTKVKT